MIPNLFAAVLALTLVEALALIVWHRRFNGPPPEAVLGQLASGSCILLAAWLALTGADPLPVAACLAASGLVHALDLRRRFIHQGRPR